MRIIVHNSNILVSFISPGVTNSGRRVLLPYIDRYIYVSQMETGEAEIIQPLPWHPNIVALLLSYPFQGLAISSPHRCKQNASETPSDRFHASQTTPEPLIDLVIWSISCCSCSRVANYLSRDSVTECLRSNTQAEQNKPSPGQAVDVLWRQGRGRWWISPKSHVRWPQGR